MNNLHSKYNIQFKFGLTESEKKTVTVQKEATVMSTLVSMITINIQKFNWIEFDDQNRAMQSNISFFQV